MSGSRIKNFIILILVLAILFLLTLAIPQLWSIRQQSETTGELLAQLCQTEGITLDPEILSETLTLYELELNPSSSAEMAIATLLLGDGVTVSEDTSRFFSIYTSAAGYCSFSNSDGSFLLSLSQPQDAGGDVTEFTQDLLSRLGYDPEDVRLTYAAGSTQLVTATQKYLGATVFSSGLTLTFVDGCLTAAEGVFYISDDQPVRISESACITCADAIVAFFGARAELGWVGAEITAVTQGYIRSGIAINLTPVWRITTDTGVVEINGITRAASLVE